MKAVAKTVSGATAEIEIEGTDTLAELKVRRSRSAPWRASGSSAQLRKRKATHRRWRDAAASAALRGARRRRVVSTEPRVFVRGFARAWSAAGAELTIGIQQRPARSFFTYTGFRAGGLTTIFACICRPRLRRNFRRWVGP